MSFSVDKLKSAMPAGGARANLFKVIFTPPPGLGVQIEDSDQLTLLCKAAALPASVIGQIDVPFRGRQLKVAGDRTFENWTATIINENDFKARDFFEKWMSGLNAHSAGTGDSDMGDYYATISIYQLDRSLTEKKEYVLEGAFPVNLSAIDLSYDTTDAIEEFTVEFAYQYWTADNTTDSSGSGA